MRTLLEAHLEECAAIIAKLETAPHQARKVWVYLTALWLAGDPMLYTELDRIEAATRAGEPVTIPAMH